MHLLFTIANFCNLQKNFAPSITENQAKFHEGNSLHAYEIPKRTQQDLLNEKEYADFKNNVEFNQQGLPGHLLIGHGMDLKTFEKRDCATTANMSYAEKLDAKTITKQTQWVEGNTNVSKLSINKKDEEIPAFMGGMLKTEERKPRGYGEFTKNNDNNYHKLALRK